MDYLEKYEAEQEARREAIASFATVGSAALADRDKPRTDMPETDYPVTIIGCIRGVDGWYLAGYDKRKETIVPLEQVEQEIFSDCTICNRSNPETHVCREAGIICGGTPCIYWFPRDWKPIQQNSHEEETV